MKILFVHNFYQSFSPSGEDSVFKNEVELLRKNGIDVITYEKHNDEIKDYGLKDKFFLPLRNIWSKKTYNELKQLIKKEKPDIAHFHNIFYLISPSAYYACKEEGVPVVQTLHNFRIFCTNGLLMRDGHVCEECIPSGKSYKGNTKNSVEILNQVQNDNSQSSTRKQCHAVLNQFRGTSASPFFKRSYKTVCNFWVNNKYQLKFINNAVKYGCYRNSKISSLAIALMQHFHWMKKTWLEKVDAYITLTEFGKKKFIEAGLPEDKIFVKPNFLPDPPEPKYTYNNYAVFLGRLSAEKGISVLINAFQYLHLSTITHDLSPVKPDLSPLTHNPSPVTHNLLPITHHPFYLKIIGDGSLRENLQEIVNTGNLTEIEFTGRKSFSEAMELLQNSKFMVMPALCYEGFPMVIREAFACGKPVIASNLGAMAELVEDGKTGLLFEPGNPVDLAKKMKWMIEHEEECIEMGRNARKVFEEKYTAERNFKLLMEIYKKVIGDR